MDVDDLLDELNTMDRATPTQGQSLASLELEVMAEKERRAQCPLPACHAANRHRQKQEEEIKRNNEIRNFLTRAAPPQSGQRTSERKPIRSNRRDPKVCRFIADVKGMPLSVTSAVTGDRVYCTQRVETEQDVPEIEIVEERVEHVSLDAIQERIQRTTIRTPPRQPEMFVEQEVSKCWTHKYTPQSFSDLITDDKLNRDVIKWLKMWKPVKAASRQSVPKPSRQSGSAKSPQTSLSKKSPSGKITDFFAESVTLKIEGPAQSLSTPVRPSPSQTTPESRILILCGALGVGKTCLVNIAARLCGYYPFVIHALSDRSAEGLQSLLENLLEARSLLVQHLPNCVIFDEIDTLPPGAESRQTILKIVEFIDGKHKKNGYLKRPMIFICNEIHAPYLLPLKQRAKILYVPQPKINRALVNRLQQICMHEGVAVDLADLHRLAEESKNDVSACLNALELQSRCSERSATGTKIVKQTPFRIWDATLKPPAAEVSFEDLLQLYEGFGEYDLIMKGIFWNVPRMHLQDGNFKKTKKIAELMSEMSSWIWSVGNRCPVLFAAVRRIAESTDRSFKVEWPREEFEFMKQLNLNTHALDSFFDNLPPKVSTLFQRGAFVVDVLPFLTMLSQTGMSALEVKNALTGACRLKLLDIIKPTNSTLNAQGHQEAPVEGLVKWKRKADDPLQSAKKASKHTDGADPPHCPS